MFSYSLHNTAVDCSFLSADVDFSADSLATVSVNISYQILSVLWTNKDKIVATAVSGKNVGCFYAKQLRLCPYL